MLNEKQVLEKSKLMKDVTLVKLLLIAFKICY